MFFRVSFQCFFSDFFSRFLNVQVGSFRVPLGFHLGCHLGFFYFFWFSLRVPVSVYLGFQSRVSFLGLNLGFI